MGSDSEDDGIERTVCLVKECFVYKIPPASDAEGYYAASWKDQVWVGPVRVIVKEKEGRIEFFNRADDTVFATAFIREESGCPYEPVKDSSRYFVIKIEGKGGKKAYVGIGFQQRSDAFDFNVSVQDYLKQLKDGDKELDSDEEIEAGDYTLKDGQKLNINVSVKSTGAGLKKKKKTEIKAEGGMLAPPPPAGAGRRARR